jgi:hypothetical protein
VYSSNYETRATIKLHQQTLLKEAAQDRLLSETQRTGSHPIRRALFATGRLLVAIGTRLEDRYALATTNASAAAQTSSESCQPISV